MSSTNPASGGSAEPVRSLEHSSENDDQAQRRGLLEQVLRETLTSDTDRHLSPAEWSALREVARRYRDQELNADPVGAAIVESLLRVRFPELHRQNDFAEMVHSISQSLVEAVNIRPRLETFWNRLRESLQ